MSTFDKMSAFLPKKVFLQPAFISFDTDASGMRKLNIQPCGAKTLVTARELLDNVKAVKRVSSTTINMNPTAGGEVASHSPRNDSLQPNITALPHSDFINPEWMASMDVEALVSIYNPPDTWKMVAGYIEHNDQCIGLRFDLHNKEIKELQEDHADELEDLKAAHKKDIQKMRAKQGAENATFRRNMTNTMRETILSQQRENEHLRQSNKNKDQEIADLRHQLEMQATKQDHVLQACFKQQQEMDLERGAAVEAADRCKQELVDTDALAGRVVAKAMQSEQDFKKEVHRLHQELASASKINQFLISHVNCLENTVATHAVQIQNAVPLCQAVATIHDIQEQNKLLINVASQQGNEIVTLQECNNVLDDALSGLQIKNGILDWELNMAASDNAMLEDEIEHLRLQNARIAKLEHDNSTLQDELNINWAKSAPEGVWGSIINKLHTQLNEAKAELTHANINNARLKAITDVHKDCAGTRRSAEDTIEFKDDMIAALQKNINHVVDAFDCLRIRAGLEPFVPTADTIGLKKVNLGSMQQCLAASENYHLRDQDIAFAERQDAVMAQDLPPDYDTLFPGADESSGLERCVLRVLDNVANMLDEVKNGGDIYVRHCGLRPFHGDDDADEWESSSSDPASSNATKASDSSDSSSTESSSSESTNPSSSFNSSGSGSSISTQAVMEILRRRAAEFTARAAQGRSAQTQRPQFANTKALLNEVREDARSKSSSSSEEVHDCILEEVVF